MPFNSKSKWIAQSARLSRFMADRGMIVSVIYAFSRLVGAKLEVAGDGGLDVYGEPGDAGGANRLQGWRRSLTKA